MEFTKRFKFFTMISAIILIAGLIVGIAKGANVGIEFSGGTIFTIDMGQDFNSADVQAAAEKNGIPNVVIGKSGVNAQTQTQAIIRMRPSNDDAKENEERTALLSTIQEKYPKAQVGGVDRVGAIASQDLIRNALLSIAIASVLILIYIWIRFEIMSGIAAVIALLHDVAIMLAITVILQVQINSSFIAAVLTIVGYSINNTIVIFDRVRENKKLMTGGKSSPSLETIVNSSISQSMTRSILTSLTTLLTITMVYILGVPSIKEFALPIIVGLLAGTYSSVFLAAPAWCVLEQKFVKKN